LLHVTDATLTSVLGNETPGSATGSAAKTSLTTHSDRAAHVDAPTAAAGSDDNSDDMIDNDSGNDSGNDTTDLNPPTTDTHRRSDHGHGHGHGHDGHGHDGHGHDGIDDMDDIAQGGPAAQHRREFLFQGKWYSRPVESVYVEQEEEAEVTQQRGVPEYRGVDVSKLGTVEQFFHRRWVPWVHRGRYAIIVALVVMAVRWGVCVCVCV